MKVRKIACISLIIAFALSGCQNEDIVMDYPDADKNGALAEKEVTPTKAVVVDKSEDGSRISYDITDEKGNQLFKVDADIVADYDKTYPVYNVDPAQMPSNQVTHIATGFFDKDSITVLMPCEIADQTYLTERLTQLKLRKEAIENQGEEVPNYIIEEMDDINEVLLSNKDRYIIDCPEVPSWIELNDYYQNKCGEDISAKFCFVEGLYEGDYYRLDIIEHANNLSIRSYKLNESYCMSDGYNLIGDIKYIPNTDDIELTDRQAEESAVRMIEALGMDYLSVIDEKPAFIYGREPEVPGDYGYQKPAYACFFALDNSGKSRPATAYTDFYSDSYTSTNTTLDARNILKADVFDEMNAEYNALYKEGGDYFAGYESTCVCISESGIVELYLTNPIHRSTTSVTNTTLLDFDSIDESARRFLSVAEQYDESFGYEINEIDRIELGMCRAITKEGKYYMLPAWYYMMVPQNGEVLPKPAVVVNAIDGSIIDVGRGGIVIDI